MLQKSKDVNLVITDEFADTGTHLDGIWLAGLLIMFCRNGSDPVLDHEFVIIDTRQGENNELIAAKTADNIGAPECVVEDRSDLTESKVTIVVSELVVDHLKVIHVRIADECFLAPVDRIRDGFLSELQESSSVVETCKFVGFGFLGQEAVVSHELLE